MNTKHFHCHRHRGSHGTLKLGEGEANQRADTKDEWRPIAECCAKETHASGDAPQESCTAEREDDKRCRPGQS